MGRFLSFIIFMACLIMFATMAGSVVAGLSGNEAAGGLTSFFLSFLGTMKLAKFYMGG